MTRSNSIKKTLFVICCFVYSNLLFAQSQIAWKEWNKDVFVTAKKQNKLVLLDLKANWCHWCHVMDDSTYSNKKVIEYLNEHFICVAADQDQRPDLAALYRDYGWPATIFFNSDGEAIVKREGYMDPRVFLKLLKAIVTDPSPEEKTAKSITVSNDTGYFQQTGKKIVLDKFYDYLDMKKGGLTGFQKSIDFDTFEYALENYQHDSSLLGWLTKTIVNSGGVFDKEWGGIYQYSTFEDWNNPHFEKLLAEQARYIKIYCWYYSTFGDMQALQKAEMIATYCYRFLKAQTPGFYNAQDADLVKGEKAIDYFKLPDSERIKLGIPTVDTNVFTENNAQLAQSFVILWATTGQEKYLQTATESIDYLLKTRSQKTGGFCHKNTNEEVLALSDNLQMLRALLAIYQATGNKYYFEELNKQAIFIEQHFAANNGSYLSFIGNNGLTAAAVISENIDLCRTFNLFSHLTHNTDFKNEAKKIMRYLTSEAVIADIITEAGILTASTETSREPMSAQFLVVSENDEAKEMFRELVSLPEYYLLFKRFSASEIPEDKKDIFSAFTTNVLFFCTSTYCSSPIYTKKAILDFFYRSKKS